MGYLISFIRILLITTLIINAVCFEIPSQISDQLPIGGGSAYQAHEGVIYIYGGSVKNVSNNNYIPGALCKIYIDSNATHETGGGFHIEYLNRFGDYGYGQLLLLNDNQTLLTIGGENLFAESTLQNDQNNQTNQTNQTTQSPPTPPTIAATMKLYHISNNTWSDPPIANTPKVPTNRARLAAAVAPNGLVYVVGGDVAGTETKYDFFSYNPVTGVFTDLTSSYQSLPYLSYPGSCASLIIKPDGNMLILFGTTFDNDINSHFTGAQQVHSFNTNTNQWISFNNTNYPDGPTAGRLCPTVMLNFNKTAVYVFGGASTPSSITSNLYNDILIYNLTTNTWSKPQTIGFIPVARMFAFGGFLDEAHLLVARGTIYEFSDNSLDLLRIPSDSTQALQWVNTFGEDLLAQSSTSVGSDGKIAVFVIGTLIGVIIIGILLWWFRKCLKITIINFPHYIWRPRTGEPNWTELLRITSQITLLFLYIAFVIFIGTQVYNSQSITLMIDVDTPLVNLPSIRVCVEGISEQGIFFLPSLPHTKCILPNGQLCSSTDFKQLDLSIFRPDYGTSLPDMVCHYFNGDRIFIGSDEAGNPNTSPLQFNIYTNTSNRGAIHVDLFPNNYAPVGSIYFNVTSYMSKYQVDQWKKKDKKGSHLTNSFNILPGQYINIGYQLVDHNYLTDNGWNYIGFKPLYNSTPELITTQSLGSLNLDGTSTYSTPASYIRVIPQVMTKKILQEQKLYTIVAALSYLGGLFSLFFAIQTLFFGFRPASPWGLVHRWTFGKLRRSISNGLVSKFQVFNTPVPFASPIHPRFSTLEMKGYGYQNNDSHHGDNDDNNCTDDDKEKSEKEPLTQIEKDEDRFELIENRLQLMELIFKSYYINDDIFQSLDKAIKKEQKSKLRNRKVKNNRNWGSGSTLENESPNPIQNEKEEKKKKKGCLPNFIKKSNTSLLEQNNHSFNNHPPELRLQQHQAILNSNDNHHHPSDHPNSSSTYHLDDKI
ncbi:unnamed protein product [Cunninghamella blakesleeana]